MRGSSSAMAWFDEVQFFTTGISRPRRAAFWREPAAPSCLAWVPVEASVRLAAGPEKIDPESVRVHRRVRRRQPTMPHLRHDILSGRIPEFDNWSIAPPADWMTDAFRERTDRLRDAASKLLPPIDTEIPVDVTKPIVAPAMTDRLRERLEHQRARMRELGYGGDPVE